jgi:hypothetical protein
MEDHHSTPPELKGLDNFSTLLDSQFRIPGTNTRFGVDFIIGLIPYVGDLISFLFSGGLSLDHGKAWRKWPSIGKNVI